MPSRLGLSAALAVTLAVSRPTPVLAQGPPEWRVGTGFLISRPRDQRLWGVNAQREQRINRLIVYRGVASVDFLGLGLDPVVSTLGADIGLRARLAPLSALVAIGPTLAFFAAHRHVYPICQGASCFNVQEGYEPGFLLAATGSMALGLQVSSELRMFSEARLHLPSGIGQSGYAKDPHAAFVELAFGVSLVR